MILSIHCHSQEVKKDEPIRLSIYFGGGSYFIDEEQKQLIRQRLEEIENLEEFNISIHSHTDNIGGAAYNNWLSEMRSNAAKSILIEHEVPEYIITIKDFGVFNPVYSNDTWQGKVMNRRVDILFWPIVL